MVRHQKRRFQYKAPTAKFLQERIDDDGSGRVNFIKKKYKVFKFEQGENIFRILPQMFDNDGMPVHYGLDVWVHFRVGTSKSHVLCLDNMKRSFYMDKKYENDNCPLCRERIKLLEGNEDADMDFIKSLYPANLVLYWIINRKDRENKKPIVLSVNKKIDNDISYSCIDKQTGQVIPIADPWEGFDIFREREGLGFKNTRYKPIVIARYPSAIFKNDDDVEDCLDFLEENPLPDILNWLGEDEINDLYSMADYGNQEDYDDYSVSTLNWNDIHNMDIDGLDDLVKEKALNINTNLYDNSNIGKYRNVICKELKIEEEYNKDDDSYNGLNWNDIHNMDFDELDDLLEKENLRLDFNSFDENDFESYADKVCEVLGIVKSRKSKPRSDPHRRRNIAEEFERNR